MSEIDDGGAAFPHAPYATDSSNWSDGSQGMTLRDHFAAAALQGILAYYIDVSPAKVAKVSYEYADAMLAARKEEA